MLKQKPLLAILRLRGKERLGHAALKVMAANRLGAPTSAQPTQVYWTLGRAPGWFRAAMGIAHGHINEQIERMYVSHGREFLGTVAVYPFVVKGEGPSWFSWAFHIPQS